MYRLILLGVEVFVELRLRLQRISATGFNHDLSSGIFYLLFPYPIAGIVF
jgi:hypothetical protein